MSFNYGRSLIAPQALSSNLLLEKMMAGFGRTGISRLKTLFATGCLHRNAVLSNRLCSSTSQLTDAQRFNLTDPTKNPQYEKEVERFKDISDPDQVRKKDNK